MGRNSRTLAFFISLVLATQGLALAAPSDATPAGAVPPITASFQAFWASARGKSFEEQVTLWKRYIQGPREALYRSVVWNESDLPSNWRNLKTELLKMRFAQYPRIAPQIPLEIQTIRRALRIESVRFRGFFPGASRRPRVAIVLAPDFDSKSGVLPGGKPIVALAADTLLLEKANFRILLPHELFHLYDAEHAGVMNDGVMPGTRITLPLFAEGLATYVSSVVSPGYADGQYLLGRDLGKLPASRLPAMARAFLKDAGSMSIDPATHTLSAAYILWFTDAKPRNPTVPGRAGYWLGLQLIRRLRERYPLQRIASWSPKEAQREMDSALETAVRVTP